MTNADKFKSLFGLYATELWAMPEKDFLKWLNSEAMNCSEFPNNSDCISRQAAITAIQKAYADTEGGTDKCAVWKNVGLTNALHIMQDLPSAQPEPEHTMEEFMYGQDLGSPEDGSL